VLRFLDAPLWLARRHLGPLLALAIPARLAPAIPSALGQALSLSQPGGSGSPTGPLLGMLFSYLAIGVSLLVSVGLYAALVHNIAGRLRGEAPTALESWRFALRPAVAGTVLIVGVVTVVGAMMCVLPGLLAGAWFCLAVPVAVEEGLYGGKALDRALLLARHGRQGPWLSSTAATALCMIVAYTGINYAVASVATVPAMVAAMVTAFQAAAAGQGHLDPSAILPLWMVPLTSFGGAIAAAFSDIYLATGLVLLYRRAVDLLEGHDLRAAIGERP